MTDRELMQQALGLVDSLHHVTEDFRIANRCIDLIEALRARLAQPEIEPPWINNTQTGNFFTPPQREWQKLTNEEIHDLVMKWAVELVFEVEQLLKRKNT